MKVKVIQQFGGHQVGDVIEGKGKFDLTAYARWIELGWAEEIDAKRKRKPPADKAVKQPNEEK